MSSKEFKIKDDLEDLKDAWINPTGGYGDILLLSGVLKQFVDADPTVKFNLVRRAIYSDLFKGHPAIRRMGYPPKNAQIITTDYWLKEKLGKKNKRPYQILARLFGLQTPIEEKLYLPEENNDDRLFQDFIPTDRGKIAIIAPSSVSPRKMMDPMIWHIIVEKLKNNGLFVIQVGHKDDIYIKGTYSLLGLTSTRQLVSLLTKGDIIISVDNFVMHAAHLAGKSAIIIWGPTRADIYGYPGQIHFQCPINHCAFRNKCLGPQYPENYRSPCPVRNRHCMNLVQLDTIIENVNHICFPDNYQ
jgi:ADP-heptose:LPS heptosyltransferase